MTKRGTSGWSFRCVAAAGALGAGLGCGEPNVVDRVTVAGAEASFDTSGPVATISAGPRSDGAPRGRPSASRKAHR